MVGPAGQRPCSAIQNAGTSIAALANVLPRTIVASKSCGSASNCATTASPAGVALNQLPHLPFAQGKESRFRQRKEEACPGEQQNQNRSRYRRWMHAPTGCWKTQGMAKAIGFAPCEKQWRSIVTLIPGRVCMAHTLMYLNPCNYEVDGKGEATATEG